MVVGKAAQWAVQKAALMVHQLVDQSAGTLGIQMAARSASNSGHLMAASWELTMAARSAWMTEQTTAVTMAVQMVIGMVAA